jgi:predicted DNA-binding protein (MmcQ/YjbR family)
MSLRSNIIKFVSTLGNVQIDSPFEKFPDYVVFRHKDTDKWFGLVMTVEKRKLGINDDNSLDVINVKADPEIISILKQSSGYLPAYHMNKNHWITILLDGSIEEKQIENLIKDSYNLTTK